jgi:sec-independent protein translocase protein TatA
VRSHFKEEDDMPQLGVPELVLILVIVIAVFGAGKLANIGGALGKGIRDFRTSVKDENAEKAAAVAAAEAQSVAKVQPVAPQAVVDAEPVVQPPSEGGPSA